MFSLNGDKMKKGNEVGRKRTPNKEELPTVRKKRRWGVVGVGRSPDKDFSKFTFLQEAFTC
jgi:hypothetical protein